MGMAPWESTHHVVLITCQRGGAEVDLGRYEVACCPLTSLSVCIDPGQHKEESFVLIMDHVSIEE